MKEKEKNINISVFSNLICRKCAAKRSRSQASIFGAIVVAPSLVAKDEQQLIE